MARIVEATIPGLNGMLRDLGKLPKQAQAELRDASAAIADRRMVPAWRAAAQRAGAWGDKIAASIKARRDRIPSITIGGNRKSFSGGATPTMVRYPSSAGQIRPSIPAAFSRTGWLDNAYPAYIGGAVQDWADAVGRVCRDFNNGKDW